MKTTMKIDHKTYYREILKKATQLEMTSREFVKSLGISNDAYHRDRRLETMPKSRYDNYKKAGVNIDLCIRG